MNLARRIENLERVAGRKDQPISDAVIKFVAPEWGDNGRIGPGKIVSGVRMSYGKLPQWLDADMNPVTTAT